MNPTLLLDLDGTLVDSVPDLAAAVNRMLAVRSLAPLALGAVTSMVGDGLQALVERGLAARGQRFDPAALATVGADYAVNLAVASRLFPDVVPSLAALAESGWRLAVCTNKPEVAARSLLAALGIGERFAAIGGGDSFPVRKPDPTHLLATLAAAGGEPARAVMVGDHANDIAAARGAGVRVVFAAWGYGPASLGTRADAVADRFSALPAIVRSLVAA